MNGGRGGIDVFVYSSGRDEIERFGTGDTVELATSLGVSNFSELLDRARSVDDGDDTLIDFGGGNTLLLEDVRLGSLTADMFGFSDTGGGGGGGTGGGSSGNTFIGTSGNDDITGTNNADIIKGLAGNDDLEGRGGNDTIKGGAGRDDIEGGGGNDTLRGGSGRDDLDGGNGRDRINGGNGDDDMDGGGGSDVFIFTSGRDKIGDFGGGDRIKLAASLDVSSFDELNFVPRDGGDDTLIRFGDGNSLLLEDVRIAELDSGDFLFA